MTVELNGTPRNVRRVIFTIDKDEDLYFAIEHHLDTENIEVLVTDYFGATHVPDFHIQGPNNVEVMLNGSPARPFTIRITG